MKGSGWTEIGGSDVPV
ncbi:putative guanylate kinase [Leptospira interrogans str. 2002000626]|uniref:Putative guanylate kinase n=2 Tax=Leptospira interrogans TaxID=173 RepID=A0A829CVB5_LEPIR|nr:putative guanylate kinase [Leptospira interrogans str. 2002000626]EMY27224.1 putative guanylate kinase [Leptospira interrogans serovar Australis str. 200703203]